jgi:hypothetical protein
MAKAAIEDGQTTQWPNEEKNDIQNNTQKI